MTRPLYDAIAFKYRIAGPEPLPVAPILIELADQGYAGAWDTDRIALANALSARGINLRDGILTAQGDLMAVHPDATGYVPFQKAARHVMRWKTHPIDPSDLIEQTGMTGELVPYADLRRVLERAGLHFLPGLGYWKHPIHSDQFTRMVSVSKSPRRIAGVIDLFRRYGWPLAGRDMKKWSANALQGKHVSEEAARGNMFVRPIGIGLFVPADQTSEIPMSCNVADFLLASKVTREISSDDDLRSFRIARLMERKGMASLTYRRRPPSQGRGQYVIFEPNREGLKVLLKAARRPTEVF